MTYALTALTTEEQSKVPTPGYVPLTFDELIEALRVRPVENLPRVYGYLEPVEGENHGQIVKLSSEYYVGKYDGRLSFAWASSTTVFDLIRQA